MSIISTQVKDNLIINGGFPIPQRGTSFASPVDSTYTLDRWQYGKSGDMVHTISQDTDVPTLVQSGITAQSSLKIDCTTVDSSIGATDFCVIRQVVEGYNIAPYVGRTLTLSFWVKATKTGTYCIAFFNSGNDRRFVTEYTVNTTDTWEKKSIIIPMNFSGGTWNYTNGSGLKIWFMLACGSDYQTATTNAWQTSSTALATSNQVNACDNTSNNFWLANVKLEPGSIATPFIPRRFEDELRLCQRYYQKSYEVLTAPGTDTYLGLCSASNQYTTQTAYFNGFNFPVEMRGVPNVTIYSKQGTAGKADDVDSTEIANATVATPSSKGWRYLQTDSTASWAARMFHYIATAEL